MADLQGTGFQPWGAKSEVVGIYYRGGGKEGPTIPLYSAAHQTQILGAFPSPISPTRGREVESVFTPPVPYRLSERFFLVLRAFGALEEPVCSSHSSPTFSAVPDSPPFWSCGREKRWEVMTVLCRTALQQTSGVPALSWAEPYLDWAYAARKLFR